MSDVLTFLSGGVLGAVAGFGGTYLKYRTDSTHLADLRDQRREKRRAERRDAYRDFLNVETELTSIQFAERASEIRPEYYQDVLDDLAKKMNAVVLVGTPEVRDAVQALLDSWHAVRRNRAEIAERRTALLDAMRADVVDL